MSESMEFQITKKDAVIAVQSITIEVLRDQLCRYVKALRSFDGVDHASYGIYLTNEQEVAAGQPLSPDSNAVEPQGTTDAEIAAEAEEGQE